MAWLCPPCLLARRITIRASRLLSRLLLLLHLRRVVGVRGRGLLILFDSRAQLLQQVIRHFVFSGDGLFNDGLSDFWLVGIHVAIERILPCAYSINWHIIQVAVGSGEDDHDLFFNWYWLVLWLLQDFCQTLTTVNTGLRDLIQVG